MTEIKNLIQTAHDIITRTRAERGDSKVKTALTNRAIALGFFAAMSGTVGQIKAHFTETAKNGKPKMSKDWAVIGKQFSSGHMLASEFRKGYTLNAGKDAYLILGAPYKALSLDHADLIISAFHDGAAYEPDAGKSSSLGTIAKHAAEAMAKRNAEAAAQHDRKQLAINAYFEHGNAKKALEMGFTADSFLEQAPRTQSPEFIADVVAEGESLLQMLEAEEMEAAKLRNQETALETAIKVLTGINPADLMPYLDQLESVVSAVRASAMEETDNAENVQASGTFG